MWSRYSTFNKSALITSQMVIWYHNMCSFTMFNVQKVTFGWKKSWQCVSSHTMVHVSRSKLSFRQNECIYVIKVSQMGNKRLILCEGQNMHFTKKYNFLHGLFHHNQMHIKNSSTCTHIRTIYEEKQENTFSAVPLGLSKQSFYKHICCIETEYYSYCKSYKSFVWKVVKCIVVVSSKKCNTKQQKVILYIVPSATWGKCTSFGI